MASCHANRWTSASPRRRRNWYRRSSSRRRGSRASTRSGRGALRFLVAQDGAGSWRSNSARCKGAPAMELVGVFLADDVQERTDGGWNVWGMFRGRSFKTSDFPVRLPQVVVVTELFPGPDDLDQDHAIELRFVSPDGEEAIIGSQVVHPTDTDRWDRRYNVSAIYRCWLRFPTPGDHEFRIFANGRLIGGSPLIIGAIND